MKKKDNNRKKIIVISIFISVLVILGLFFLLNKNKDLNSSNKKIETPANKTFKDYNFYKCVVDNYNKENKTSISYDTTLSDVQLQSIKTLDCSKKEISDASGIEKLINLGYLKIYNNKLTNLDLSKNTALIWLEANNNNLASLDVGKNPSLSKLEVKNNNLTSLDVSKNSSLKTLYVSINELKNLDVSKNLKLVSLDAAHNKLTNLDINQNTLLTDLDVSGNQLTYIDISKNTLLTSINVSNNQLKKVDLSNNTNLIKIYAYNNELTSLDVRGNRSLEELNISNAVESVQSNGRKIAYKFGNNELSKIDLSNNILLTKLSIYINQSLALDLSKNNKLEKLSIGYKLAGYEGEVVKFDTGIKLPDHLKKQPIIWKSDTEASIISDAEVKLNKASNSLVYIYGYLNNEKNYSMLINLNIKKILVSSSKYNIDTDNMMILLGKKVQTYQEFISNINLETGSFKVYNGTEEIKSGTLTSGMRFEVYKDGKLSSKYTIIDGYLNMSTLNVIQSKNIINNIKIGTTLREIKNKIYTSGEVKIYDKNDKELNDNDKLSTGSVVKIKFGSKEIIYYLSVKGDITGSGTITISDVSKLYQYVRGKIKMNNCYIEAGKIISNDNITISNVSKLYQYVRGNIKEL